MKEIGIGIIGFGFMGRTHSFGYKTIPLYYKNLPFKIKMVGICDAIEAAAKDAYETLDFEYYTTDPDRVINDPNIQVINVCTPNVYHKDIVLKALKAGKHVYCDKPLATSYAETKEITDMLKDPAQITQMALQYRFNPATLRAKQIIEEGRLGRIISFRACYLHSSAIDPNKALGWKQDKKQGGGGVLFDLGSHVIDLMYHFLGEYDSVFTKTQIIYPQRPDGKGNMVTVEADDIAFMIFNMKNGAVGTVEASKVATGVNDELRFEIHGTEGALKFNLMQPNFLEFYDNRNKDVALGGYNGFTKIETVQRFPAPGGAFPNPKFTGGWIRAHVHCLYSFLDCVDRGVTASPSFSEGAYVQHVMEKAYESDERKCWVAID